MSATATTTQRPPLATSAMTGAIRSPVATPVVMIDLVGVGAPGELADQRLRPPRSWRRVWVAPKIGGLLALELDRVDGDDVAGAGHGRALHGVHADAADADDDDGLAGLDVGGVDRRAPAGGDAAADEGGLVERDVVGRS